MHVSKPFRTCPGESQNFFHKGRKILEDPSLKQMGDKSKTFKPKVLSEKDKEKYFLERNEKENVLDVKFGYPRLGESNNAEKRIGYLFNVKPV